jgi:hypothetical protein
MQGEVNNSVVISKLPSLLEGEVFTIILKSETPKDLIGKINGQ